MVMDCFEFFQEMFGLSSCAIDYKNLVWGKKKMGPLFRKITLECCIGSQDKPRNKDIMHLWQPEDQWIFYCILLDLGPYVMTCQDFRSVLGGWLTSVRFLLTEVILHFFFVYQTYNQQLSGHYTQMGTLPEFGAALSCCLGWVPYSSKAPVHRPYLPHKMSSRPYH
jgi:hypothetical protein